MKRTMVTLWRAARMPMVFRNFPTAFRNRLAIAVDSDDVVYYMRPTGSFVMQAGPADVRVLNDIWMDRIYEPVPELVVQPGWNVLDIGAHRGSFAVRAALLEPSISLTAVEPDPENLQYLRRTVELNQLDNVRIRAGAVWITEGHEILMLGGSQKSTNNRLGSVTSTGASKGRQRIQVETFTIEMLVDEIGTPIHLLKMDIEGAELEILRACPRTTLQKIERIILEYHGSGGRTPAEVSMEVSRILESNGFMVEGVAVPPLIYAVRGTMTERHDGP